MSILYLPNTQITVLFYIYKLREYYDLWLYKNAYNLLFYVILIIKI